MVTLKHAFIRTYDAQELGRNLTTRVHPKALEQLRLCLQVKVDEAESLQELICPDDSTLPKADQWQARKEQMQHTRHFELASLDGRHQTCLICGQQFSDTWLLRQHQVDLAHFNTDNFEEVLLGRKSDELARLRTWQRLSKEIGWTSDEIGSTSDEQRDSS